VCGDVQHDRRHEAEQREPADEPTGAVAWPPGDHAGDRDDHEDDRDQREDGSEDAHAVNESARQ
jgi:hypothetical protein